MRFELPILSPKDLKFIAVAAAARINVPLANSSFPPTSVLESRFRRVVMRICKRQPFFVGSRPTRFVLLRIVAGLIWLLPWANFAAENVTLQLRNGDRITGSIVSETAQQITLSTVWSKEIIIPIDQILKREIVPAESKPVEAAPTQKAGATNAPAMAGATPLPIAPKPQYWHGDLQAGLDLIFSATD